LRVIQDSWYDAAHTQRTTVDSIFPTDRRECIPNCFLRRSRLRERKGDPPSLGAKITLKGLGFRFHCSWFRVFDALYLVEPVRPATRSNQKV
jgi:hypothetical protein